MCYSIYWTSRPPSVSPAPLRELKVSNDKIIYYTTGDVTNGKYSGRGQMKYLNSGGSTLYTYDGGIVDNEEDGEG